MKKSLLLSAALLTALALSSCGSGEKTAPSTGVDNETIRTIMNRKSVRAFTDQAIPAEYMEAMLKAAMAAPTGSNIQPWHFVVLTDKTQYEKVFENNFNMRIFNSAAAVVVFCGDTTVTRPPRDNPDGAPVTRPSGTWRDDLGACTENFLLAAESLGLGAVWTAAYPYSERYASMKRELGMPDNILPYCAVAVGYPANDEQPKDKWKPERIHFDKW
ncbi:MAG: nitroreductase family protein [Bacteroidales bacterium]|nr:nitroreductase family protein [Bacteroidales bacterium]